MNHVDDRYLLGPREGDSGRVFIVMLVWQTPASATVWLIYYYFLDDFTNEFLGVYLFFDLKIYYLNFKCNTKASYRRNWLSSTADDVTGLWGFVSFIVL
ncbi:hypothetical protein O9992_05200 [Vibrio lentus]|nr:hypothetical protein [Vibrio lentus]